MARLLATVGDSFDDPLMGRPYQSGVYRNQRPPVTVDARSGRVVSSSTPRTPMPTAAPQQRTPSPAQRGDVNAKNIDYKRPGSGSEAYGLNEQNVLGWLGKLYSARDQKAGGMRQIFEAVSKWNANPQRQAAAGSTAFGRFLQTGDTKGVDPKYALQAYDFALRETGRAQQNKEGFLDSALGQVLGIGATIAAGAIGGPVASTLVGAGIGGARGGVKGALIGAASGYAAGKGVEFIKGGGLGRVASTVTGGRFGPVTNVNALMTGDTGAAIAARAGATAASSPYTWAGAAKGAASALNTAGSAVQLRNMLVGAGTAAAAYGVTQTLKPPPLVTPPPAPPMKLDPVVAEAERLRRRRRVTQTNFTWGKPMLATVSRPELSGPYA